MQSAESLIIRSLRSLTRRTAQSAPFANPIVSHRALSTAARITTRPDSGSSSSRPLSTMPNSPDPIKTTVSESSSTSTPIPEIEETASLISSFAEGIETGEMPPEVSEMWLDEFLDKISEASTKLAGATFNSAAALPIMVPLLRLMIGARNNQSYSVSLEKLGRVRIGQLAMDGRLMLARRIVASIMPAIATETIGLQGFNAMFFNSTIETAISGYPKSQKSEPYQRFRAIHGSMYGFISSENLATLTKDQYVKHWTLPQKESSFIITIK